MRILIFCFILMFVACDSGKFNGQSPNRQLLLDRIYIDKGSKDYFYISPGLYSFDKLILADSAHNYLQKYFWVIDDTTYNTFEINGKKLNYDFHNIKFAAIDFNGDTLSIDSLYFFSNITLLSPVNNYVFEDRDSVVFEYMMNMDSSTVCFGNQIVGNSLECKLFNNIYCVNNEIGKMRKCEIKYDLLDTVIRDSMYWGVIARLGEKFYSSEIRRFILRGEE